jgi:hypothetical protein
MKRRRWVRLDVNYGLRDWLLPLNGNARRLFPDFMIYLKKNGVRGGAQRFTPEGMARQLDCTVEDWSTFINAAIASGAVVIDDEGDWYYPGWDDEQEYDPKAAERMRKHRASK